MSKIHRVDQGTPEWYALRIGIPTASMFHKIITPTTMKPSSQSREYMYRLIAERLLNEPMEDSLNRIEQIERGKMDEPNAAAQLSFTHDLKLDPVGFVTDDAGRMGCSPDRLVFGRGVPEPVEIKCPAAWTQVGYLLDGLGDHYRPQVQGQLYIGGFEKAHFYSWHRQMPPKYLITERDEQFIRVLSDVLERFLDDLDAETARARKMGSFAAFVRERAPDLINPLMAG